MYQHTLPCKAAPTSCYYHPVTDNHRCRFIRDLVVLGWYAINQKGWSTSEVIELVIQATDYKYFLEEQAAHHSSRGALKLSQSARACTVKYAQVFVSYCDAT